MIYRFLLFLAVCFTFIACTKDREDDAINSETVYTYSLNCGWCFGDFELIVDQELYKLSTSEITGNCQFENYSSNTDADTWQALNSLLSFETFSEIELSSYHIAYDGCDYTLKIEHQGEVHSIRYGHAEMDDVQSIQPLIDKLEEIRASLF